MSAETIYARHRVEALLATGGLLLTAVAVHSHDEDGLAIGLTVFAVLLAAFVLRRPRLHVDSDGLLVVNLLRSHRIPWNEIAGFGFGTTGATPCLTIRRADGSVVSAAVVNDNYRSGYPQAQLDAIIADLQNRLAAANGSNVSRELDDLAPGAPLPRARRSSLRLTIVTWLLLCLFLLVFGIVTAWHAASDLPGTYSRLEAHGMRTTATFAGCRVTGVRHHECRLTLDFRGQIRTWTYSEDYPQFNGTAVGAPVDVLVDPKQPSTVYTAHDVAIRYDAGFGVLAIVGIVFAVLGFLGLAFLLWLQHLAAAARSRLSR